MSEKNLFESAVEAGMLMSRVNELPGTEPWVLVPNLGAHIQSLEHLREAPSSIRQEVSFTELQSFMRYVNKFKRASTVVFVDAVKERLLAVIDYHEAEQAAWGRHRAIYSCPRSVEWTRWQTNDGKAMHQIAFAEFIEQNQLDIHAPPGAEMLEVTRTLMAKTEVDFGSAVRLDNGNVSFRYEALTTAKAGEKGAMQVPEMFTLGLPLFVGGPLQPVGARLRYRIVERRLVFHYVLVNPHLVVQEAFARLIEEVGEETGCEVYAGGVCHGGT